MTNLIGALQGIVGEPHVLTEQAERAFHSMDAFWTGEVAAAVARPGTVAELSDVVRVATDAGYAVVARGGGMSYTAGYVPTRADTVIVDMRRINGIVEIDDEDMTVTAEAGCTWSELGSALHRRGLRTPYFGPMSGLVATVGGTLSNNSMFYGSGVYGTVADSVLGLTVVLADGRRVVTGSGATRGKDPFHRHYGPDLTGLFLSDSGALGIKAAATLRLVREPAVTAFASYAFDDFDSLFEAQAEIARHRLAAECFGMDPFLNGQMTAPATVSDGLRVLGRVARAGHSPLAGAADALRIVLAGRRFAKDVAWSLHVTIDGRSHAAVRSDLAVVRRIAGRRGSSIPATLPTVIRAAPFQPVGPFLVGHHGERWVPIHACLPLSKVQRAYALMQEVFGRHRDILERFRIQTSLLTAVAGTDFIFEPAFYYPDALTPYHLRYLAPADAARYAAHPRVEGANDAVVSLLDGLKRAFLDLGAVHQQIGKFYPYRDGLDPVPRAIIDDLKRLLDTRGLMNPGALGLGLE